MHQQTNGISSSTKSHKTDTQDVADGDDDVRVGNASSMLRLPTDALLCILYSLDILDILKIRQVRSGSHSCLAHGST